MTATEDRLRAVLAERAGTVDEDGLRPLAFPVPRRRRWPRLVAPVAAATAVVLAVGAEILVGHLAGPPKPPPPPAKVHPLAPRTVKVGGQPASLSYDATNGTLYVAVSSRYIQRHGRFRLKPSALAMIDTATCNGSDAAGCAHISHAPAGGRGTPVVAVNERTHTVYAVNSASRTLAVINANTCNAVTTDDCRATLVRLPQVPEFLAVSPRTDTIYVNDASSGPSPAKMLVINGATCNASNTSGCHTPPVKVSFGAAVSGVTNLTVDPASNTVYLNGLHGPALISGQTCTGTDTGGCAHVLARVPVAGTGRAVTIDPAAGTIYVSDTAAGQVLAVGLSTCDARSTAGCAHPRTIRSAGGPIGLAADPGTSTLYVSNARNAVSMINTRRCNAAGVTACAKSPPSFPVGSFPLDVVVAARRNTVYVLNVSSGSVSVISTVTCNVTDTHGCPP